MAIKCTLMPKTKHTHAADRAVEKGAGMKGLTLKLGEGDKSLHCYLKSTEHDWYTLAATDTQKHKPVHSNVLHSLAAVALV